MKIRIDKFYDEDFEIIASVPLASALNLHDILRSSQTYIFNPFMIRYVTVMERNGSLISKTIQPLLHVKIAVVGINCSS